MTGDTHPKHSIRLDLPGEGAPPILLVARGYLTHQAIATLRESWNGAFQGPSKQAVVIEAGDMDVYQCVDGRWEPLN